MKLFFRKEGSGAPLIIIHGLYGSSDNWLGVAKKLASAFTVYAIDLRNHGHSPHDPEHTYQAMKSDLVRFFDDHIREKAIIIGHSMGGKLAMWFASEYPELIRQLIIADIAPVNYREVDDEGQYFLHRNILQAMIGLDFSRVKNRKQVEEILAEQIDSPRIRQFLLKNVAADHHTHHLKWRLHVNALWEYIDEIVEGVNIRWLDDRIPIIAYPVTFIRGLESHYVSDEFIPVIKKIYPEALIIGIPGAGHWLHAEQPELFMEAVMGTLGPLMVSKW